MDLSRIEMWTRKALEAEAERRGIRDPHLRSRTELVRLILRQHYGGPVGRGRKRFADGLHTLRQAKDLLGAAVEAATENLPNPFRRTSPGTTPSPAPRPAPPAPPTSPRDTRSGRPSDARTTREQPVSQRDPDVGNFDDDLFASLRPSEPRSEPPMTTSDVVPSTEGSLRAGAADIPSPPQLGALETPASETAPPARADSGPPEAPLGSTGPLAPSLQVADVDQSRSQQTDEPPAQGTDERPSRVTDVPQEVLQAIAAAPAESAPEAQSQPEPAPAAAPSRATTAIFEQEPIRTHSMARLLAHQGHRERALAIYEELLARHTDEPTLLEEAEILRGGGDIERIPSHLPGPRSDYPLPVSADHVGCEGSPEAGLRVHWTVTPEGTARAQAVLGEAGELAIRVVAISRDPERVVRSEITEHGPVDADGSWQAQPLDPDARCFVAIGVRSQSRFVSIAHTRPH